MVAPSLPRFNDQTTMSQENETRTNNSNIGCGYILSQGALICLLLIFNGFLVRSTVNLDWGEEVRISQAIQLVLPVALIFVELWLYDFIFASHTRNEM